MRMILKDWLRPAPGSMAAPPLPGELLFLTSIALDMFGFRTRGVARRRTFQSAPMP